jgi:uncharacterized protein (TIGR03000 family)
MEGSVIYDGGVILDSSLDSGVITSGGYETGTISDGVPLQGTIIDSKTSGDSARYESAKPAIDDKQAIESDAAMLTVSVPIENARVTVNGHETSSDGSIRQFMSRGLKKGYVYTYVVKVEYESNGDTKTDEKSVKLRSGETERVEFEKPTEPAGADVTVTKNADMTTVVRLHVPADAKVTLAGNETKGNGSIRTFRTTQLKPGEQWSNYTVNVTAVIHGQSVSQERTVNVVAGSTTELTFNFDSISVARR